MSVTLADTYGDLVEHLDNQLRDVVRRDGIDPQREVTLVRGIATRLVAEHDQRSLTGIVAPVGDHEAVVEELVARIAGFGPLQRYLDDPEVEEIWVNDPSRVFVARAGRHELTSTILDRSQVAELVERMLKSSGRMNSSSRISPGGIGSSCFLAIANLSGSPQFQRRRRCLRPI